MSVSGFLSKTYEIFSDPNNVDICSWGVHGDTIHVKKVEMENERCCNVLLD